MTGPVLEISSNGSMRQVALGAEPVTVGRQIANMVVIDDTQASRFHCVIEKVAAGYRVRDLGSRNGTRLNGQIVKAALIDDGDVVSIGKVEMRIVKEAPPPAPAKSAHPPAPSASSHHDTIHSGGIQLTALDEPEPIEEPAPKASGPVVDTNAPADQSLLQMANALPEKSFNHYDIALLNARGGVAHAAGASRKKDGDNVGEAVTLLRLMLLICFRTRASDIHIEPKNDLYLIRVRIDGVMVDAAKLKKEMGVRLCAVVKVISDIDIAQRNIVQEGHFSTRVPDRRVDYRVSFTPAMYGQKCVIRVLDAANSPRYLWDLGMPDWMFTDIDRTIRGEGGMVLVCGPTGSGKTASLYATLRSIDSGERNVITIEDPVEIQIEGITQMPVNDDQGNTFAALLRSVLRQDPDVILVGEIRDGETARTAIQAAMTGHLVFSTVHARDTVGTVFRLLDLGLEPYLVASALQLVIAQRLVRQICPHCRVGFKPAPDQSAKLDSAMGKPVPQIFRAAGCPKCLHTGYFGRRAIFELLTVTNAVRDAMQKNCAPADIYRALEGTKFSKLLTSGYQLVAEGMTTMDEVERVVGL